MTLLISFKDGSGDWGKADCLVCSVGVDEDIVYSKSTALQSWLLGYELTDTIIVFAEVFFFSRLLIIITGVYI